MQTAVLIPLHPRGPWRFGPGDGAGQDLDTLYRSDRLFSALTLAFADLGQLEPWLEATARASQPQILLSSLFPFQSDTLFVPPPCSMWPPPAGLITSPSPVFLSKLRWNLARFVPVSLIQSLLLGQPALADQWTVDAESACLLRRDRPSTAPFRFAVRRRAAVDRLTRTSAQADRVSCVEFEPSAGLWTAVTFRDESAEQSWRGLLESAFRLLADTGLGARRTIGWGQFTTAPWQHGRWPDLLFPKLPADKTARSHWLLSLYSPSPSDQVDWRAGHYRLTCRGGRAHHAGILKKTARMVVEGSVLSTAAAPVGRALDVAPDGLPHPLYRSGFALSIPLPETPAPEPAPQNANPVEQAPSPESTDYEI
jgi:CRISPR type III-A-associated RAMP protein Csm4